MAALDQWLLLISGCCNVCPLSVRIAGDRAGAMRHYERALAVTPHSAEAMYNTAVALAEDGATNRSIFMYAPVYYS